MLLENVSFQFLPAFLWIRATALQMAGMCKRKSPGFNVLLFPVSMYLLFLFMHNHLVTCMEMQRNQGSGKWIFKHCLTLIYQFLAPMLSMRQLAPGIAVCRRCKRNALKSPVNQYIVKRGSSPLGWSFPSIENLFQDTEVLCIYWNCSIYLISELN